MDTMEIVIVTPPDVRRAIATQEEFAVARAAYQRQVMNRLLGRNVTKNVYLGLVGLGEMGNQLLAAKVGDRFRVTGEIREEEYTSKQTGEDKTDLKLVIESMTFIAGRDEAPSASGAGLRSVG